MQPQQTSEELLLEARISIAQGFIHHSREDFLQCGEVMAKALLQTQSKDLIDALEVNQKSFREMGTANSVLFRNKAAVKRRTAWPIIRKGLNRVLKQQEESELTPTTIRAAAHEFFDSYCRAAFPRPELNDSNSERHQMTA